MTESPPSIAPATSPVGCVEGKGARDKGGYVKAFYQGKHTRAHRVAYCRARGLSPAPSEPSTNQAWATSQTLTATPGWVAGTT